MMKRIMAVILTVAMVASMGIVSFAADPATVKEAIYAYGEDKGLSGSALTAWLTRSLDVPTDIEVKETDKDDWKDGPITVRERSVGNIPTFDFKATVDMGVVKAAFDDYVSAAGVAINANGGANTATLLADLENIKVTGLFAVVVEVPEGLTLPQAVIDGENLYGFNDEAKAIFHEVTRTYTDNVLTINIGVGGEETASEVEATKAELDLYLGTDLTLTCEGVQPVDFDTYQMKGKFNGSTAIGGDIATIEYTSEPMGDGHNPDETAAPYASATIKVAKYLSGGSGGTSEEVELEFIVDGKVMKTVKGKEPLKVNLGEVVPESKEGFKFVGWYTDKELTKKASDPITITKDTELYAKWVVDSDTVLETEDHFAYIIGYTDGTVRPLDNIIREEVAAIFFRLLTGDAGEAMHEEVAPFSDVPQTKWSSTAIATLTKGGYITGKGDGTFAPEADITRAEFATIAARFSGDTEASNVKFSDVSGHWAESYIEVCAANGWITGYEDGTFKPDQNITRAEAMAIVNRMLGRAVDEAGIAGVESDIYKFSDNTPGTWYYYIVLEATNSHDYTRAEGAAYEVWTKVTEIRDWTAYEK